MTIARFERFFLLAILTVGLAGLWPSSAQAQDCSVTSTDIGTFVGITSQGGGFGDPSNVEAFLNGLPGISNAQRVDKVDGFPNSGSSACLPGESNNVNAQATPDTKQGVWKSVNDIPICALAIHAGGGQDVAVYTYDPPVLEGGWTTAQNTNNQGNPRDISNIQFFTCDQEPPDETGTIKIIKQTVDSEEPPQPIDIDQDFIVQINGVQVDVLNTNGSGNGMAMTPVLTRDAGQQYEVTEDLGNLPPNIELLSTGCVDDNGLVTQPFTLQSNQNVVCTITNQVSEIEGAEFRIQKLLSDSNGDPIDDVDFTFNYTNGPPPDSIVVASNTGFSSPLVIDNVEEDVTITEVAQANTNATAISCSDQGGQNVSGDLAEGDVTITADLINPGDLWSCRFENERSDPEQAQFQIRKFLTNSNGSPITDVQFQFNYTNPPGQILLPSNGEFSGPINIESLGANVVITEVLPENTTATEISCTDGEDEVDGNLGNGQVTIPAGDIDPNDEWQCTFRNVREDGRVIVEKKTIGGDDNFDFMVSGITFDGSSFQLANGESRDFELVAGTYLIEEKNLPEGWTLQGIDCGGEGDRNGTKVSIDLDGGETIRCTFTNFLENDDPSDDVVKLFINRRVSNLLTHDPDRTRIIRRLDEQRPLAKPMKYAGDEAETGGSMSAIESGPAGLPGRGSNTSVFGKSQAGGLFPAATGSALPGEQISPDSSHLGHGFAGAGSGSSSGGYASAALPFGLSGDLSSGQPTGKFSLSLSQIRDSAHASDAKKISDAKAYGNALGLGGNPYGVAYDAIPMGLTPNRLDIWAEGHLSRYDDSTGGYNRDGNFGILYVGSDYALNDWLLLGALVQFDWTDEDVRNQDLYGGVDGWGWMVGPYMGAKLSDHLYFNARAAWGQSENDMTLTDNAAGFRTGNFDTDRWLATAELIGNWYHGPWRFTPSAQLAYGSEDQEAFRNSLNQQIGSNEATIGRLTFGPEIGYRHVMGDGTIVEPLVSIEGVWNFDNDGLRLSDGTPVGDDDFTGKVEAGVMLQTPDGISWRVVGDYYGIGDGDFDSYGGQAWLSIPLN